MNQPLKRPSGVGRAGPARRSWVWRAGPARPTLLILLLAFSGVAHASDLLPPMTNGVPSEYAPRRAGAEVGADRRIHITREGLYRITHAGMLAAGITNPVGAELRLFCRTQEIALAVSADGVWTTNDFAVFFGRPHDGYWTVTNTYWLGLGGSGLRMATRDAAPQPGWPERTSHWRTVRYENKSIFTATYRPTDGSFDHWISHNIFAGLTNVFVATPDRLPAETATVHLAFWGRTESLPHNPDHFTRFAVNGQGAQTSAYDGLNFHLATNFVAQSTLSNGMNTVQLSQVFTGATDVASLEWLEVHYTASNCIRDGFLAILGAPTSNNYIAAPWDTNETPWLLDITDPAQPVLLGNSALDTNGAAGLVRWADNATIASRYWIASPTTLTDVAVAPPAPFRDFTNTARQVDYLFITHSLLSTGAYQLAKHRARDGLRTLIVPIESVYDEFSYGIKDARAIKQFLGYAFHYWSDPPPRYVVLVGDGSHDPLNRYGLAQPSDLIPAWMGPAAFDFSAQDGYLATVSDADFLRDIQIGRFPFVSPAQVTAAVARIAGYEAAPTSSSWRTRALLAADVNDPFPSDFQTASDTYILTNLVMAGVTSIWKAYEAGTNTAATRAVITNAINAVPNTGPVFSVSYFGHGASYLWNAGAFSTSHVMQLNNAIWPVVSVFSCDNGDFSNPKSLSMAEMFVMRPNRGASAAFSASGLSLQEAAKRIADGFFRHLTNGAPRRRLGDMINQGMLDLYGASGNSEELLFYNLFGDPAQVVRP